MRRLVARVLRRCQTQQTHRFAFLTQSRQDDPMVVQHRGAASLACRLPVALPLLCLVSWFSWFSWSCLLPPPTPGTCMFHIPPRRAFMLLSHAHAACQHIDQQRRTPRGIRDRPRRVFCFTLFSLFLLFVLPWALIGRRRSERGIRRTSGMGRGARQKLELCMQQQTRKRKQEHKEAELGDARSNQCERKGRMDSMGSMG